MKFDMGSETLGVLTQHTSSSNQDLGALVKKLVTAAEPLENRFNGTAKQAFDNFKLHTDEISANLNGALTSILGGQGGMDKSFRQGELEMVDTVKGTQDSANFDAANFGKRA